MKTEKQILARREKVLISLNEAYRVGLYGTVAAYDTRLDELNWVLDITEDHLEEDSEE